MYKISLSVGPLDVILTNIQSFITISGQSMTLKNWGFVEHNGIAPDSFSQPDVKGIKGGLAVPD